MDVLLEVFKARFDEALGTWCSGRRPYSWQEGWNLGTSLFKGPSNLNLFMILTQTHLAHSHEVLPSSELCIPQGALHSRTGL